MDLRAGQRLLRYEQSGYRLHIYGARARLVLFLFYDPYVPKDETLQMLSARDFTSLVSCFRNLSCATSRRLRSAFCGGGTRIARDRRGTGAPNFDYSQ